MKVQARVVYLTGKPAIARMKGYKEEKDTESPKYELTFFIREQRGSRKGNLCVCVCVPLMVITLLPLLNISEQPTSTTTTTATIY